MRRVVVAVDPSSNNGNDDKADEIGIAVAGKGIDGRGYIPGDYSCSMSPDGWGGRAVQAYKQNEADRIIDEKNFGGDMVRFVIKTADDKVPHTDVTASRGKVLRAEPVAALCEQGRVSHVGASRARDQMCQLTASGYLGEGSPDRLDAAVLALMELMVDFALPGVTTTTTVAVLY